MSFTDRKKLKKMKNAKVVKNHTTILENGRRLSFRDALFIQLAVAIGVGYISISGFYI